MLIMDKEARPVCWSLHYSMVKIVRGYPPKWTDETELMIIWFVKLLENIDGLADRNTPLRISHLLISQRRPGFWNLISIVGYGFQKSGKCIIGFFWIRWSLMSRLFTFIIPTCFSIVHFSFLEKSSKLSFRMSLIVFFRCKSFFGKVLRILNYHRYAVYFGIFFW